MEKPYTDLEVTDEYIIREFGPNIDPIHLMWHRDNEDRLVEVLEVGTDWQFQRDNSLPELLSNGDKLFIRRHEWHRVIKGFGKLLIKIHLNGEN